MCVILTFINEMENSSMHIRMLTNIGLQDILKRKVKIYFIKNLNLHTSWYNSTPLPCWDKHLLLCGFILSLAKQNDRLIRQVYVPWAVFRLGSFVHWMEVNTISLGKFWQHLFVITVFKICISIKVIGWFYNLKFCLTFCWQVENLIFT